MNAPRKICGILGGMGPAATADLLNRIIAFTDAADDYGHVRCLIDQNPQVPSRIRSLLAGAESPGPVMAKMASNLEKSGADFLCIACNTAHYWLPEVAAAVSIKVLDMPQLASRDAARAGRSCGIMATPATRLKGIYDQHLRDLGMEALYPEPEDQELLLKIIETVKGSRQDEDTVIQYHGIAARLVNAGADSIIAACTELGTLGGIPGLPLVDAADSLAKAIVSEAGAKLKQVHPDLA